MLPDFHIARSKKTLTNTNSLSKLDSIVQRIIKKECYFIRKIKCETKRKIARYFYAR